MVLFEFDEISLDPSRSRITNDIVDKFLSLLEERLRFLKYGLDVFLQFLPFRLKIIALLTDEDATVVVLLRLSRAVLAVEELVMVLAVLLSADKHDFVLAAAAHIHELLNGELSVEVCT